LTDSMHDESSQASMKRYCCGRAVAACADYPPAAARVPCVSWKQQTIYVIYKKNETKAFSKKSMHSTGLQKKSQEKQTTYQSHDLIFVFLFWTNERQRLTVRGHSKCRHEFINRLVQDKHGSAYAKHLRLSSGRVYSVGTGNRPKWSISLTCTVQLQLRRTTELHSAPHFHMLMHPGLECLVGDTIRTFLIHSRHAHIPDKACAAHT
jgi:hypothetical protein